MTPISSKCKQKLMAGFCKLLAHLCLSLIYLFFMQGTNTGAPTVIHLQVLWGLFMRFIIGSHICRHSCQADLIVFVDKLFLSTGTHLLLSMPIFFQCGHVVNFPGNRSQPWLLQ